MKIEVLFFAQLRERFGAERRMVDVEDGRSVAEVARHIMLSEEASELLSLPLSYAVNEDFVHGDHVLKDGDRLALLTPVSGG